MNTTTQPPADVTWASPDVDRIRAIRRHDVVRYRRFVDIVDELSKLVEEPDRRIRYRAVFASSHNGKSTLSEELKHLFPLRVNALGDAASMPVARVSLMGIASVGDFAIRILEELEEPFNRRSSRASLLSSAYACLRAMGVRALLLDEFQHLDAGHWRERLGLTNTIKEIGEACGLSVFVFGMPCAVKLVEGEPQLSRRFEYRPLPRWKLDGDLLSLLHTLEHRMPLREPSDMGLNEELAAAILAKTDGIFGFIYDLVEKCGITAIETGREKVDMKTLELTNWTPPKRRGAQAIEEMDARTEELLPFNDR